MKLSPTLPLIVLAVCAAMLYTRSASAGPIEDEYRMHAFKILHPELIDKNVCSPHEDDCRHYLHISAIWESTAAGKKKSMRIPDSCKAIPLGRLIDCTPRYKVKAPAAKPHHMYRGDDTYDRDTSLVGHPSHSKNCL